MRGSRAAVIASKALARARAMAHHAERMFAAGTGARESRGARLRTALLWAVGSALIAPAALAVYPEFGPHDIATVFFISKSDDRNRVDYWMRLDRNCQPVNDDAVTPYWREFEKAPPVVTHATGMLDAMAYGIAAQRIAKRSLTESDYAMRLKAVGRVIGIATRRGPSGKCVAVARTTIAGVTAELLSIHVKLSGPFSVEYIDIKGRNFKTGKAIVERMKR